LVQSFSDDDSTFVTGDTEKEDDSASRKAKLENIEKRDDYQVHKTQQTNIQTGRTKKNRQALVSLI